MNHTNASHLLALMTENPDDLTKEELEDYIWLLEQLLQEMRQRHIILRNKAAQENPVRP